VHFITTCNSELLAFSASAAEQGESASIGLGTALDCGHWSKRLCHPTPHRDGVCCGWMRACDVGGRGVCELLGPRCHHLVADALCLFNGDGVHVWYRMTSGCYDIVRWSHLQYHLIDMITKYVVYRPAKSPALSYFSVCVCRGAEQSMHVDWTHCGAVVTDQSDRASQHPTA